MLNKRDYQDAIYSQGAVNAGALVKSLAKSVDGMWDEARAQGKGADYVNTHPIMRLFAEQIGYLSSGRNYYDANTFCQEIADGKREPGDFNE